MLPFTDSPDTYWRFSFPAFVIGTIGCTILYSNSKYVLGLPRFIDQILILPFQYRDLRLYTAVSGWHRGSDL